MNAVFPLATAQTCIIHLIRGSIRYASRKYWDEWAGDLKLVYRADTPAAAEHALDALDAKWGNRYPAIIRLWRAAWAEFIPFLDYLLTRSLDPTGIGQTRWTVRWKPALNAFAITFADRIPAAEDCT